ncbi:MAG: NAD(P)/FAD-dependent oxidoreductase [Acidilobus sp.]
MKRIVVLGGGVGGYVAAKRLVEGAKKYGADVQVTVIEKGLYHLMPPLFFDVALGYATPDDARAPVQNMTKYGINVVVDEVQSIDAANRTVVGSKGKYQYDYLVVALGTENGWSAYPGLDKDGVHNYDLEGAIKMREALTQVKDGQNITILIPELPFRCGIYPYEAATALSAFFKARNKKVSIRLVDPMPSPAASLGPSISRFLLDQLQQLGVEYHPNSKFREVDVQKKAVITADGEYKYDLLVKVPPPRLPKPLASSEGFVWKQDQRWTAVLPNTRHPQYDDVYLVGEHALPPLGIGLAGVFVESLAITASTNILGDLIGGFGPAFAPSPVSCVGYAGERGWAGTCELPFDASKGTYTMKCYFTGVYTIGRLLKQAFYHGWIDGLKF